MPDNPKRAALYVRVSTDEQAAEGYSLDAQKNILEDHCLAEGLDVASIYDPGTFWSYSRWTVSTGTAATSCP